MQKKSTMSKILKEIIHRMKIEKYIDMIIDPDTNNITPLGYILYQTRDPSILKYRPGEIVIVKDDEVSPFRNRYVQLYHKYLKEVWKPVEADYYIGLPCTAIKPYKRSVTHRMMNNYVIKLQKKYGVKIEIFSVSEPMLIVPQRYEELFPLSNYDFPPKLMSNEEKTFMINELTKILPMIVKASRRMTVFILPKHHYFIVSNAISKLKDNLPTKVKIFPYGRLAFKALQEVYYYLIHDIEKYYKRRKKEKRLA